MFWRIALSAVSISGHKKVLLFMLRVAVASVATSECAGTNYNNFIIICSILP